MTAEPCSPRPLPARSGRSSAGWEARRPEPAHPRPGLAGPAVIQRQHVMAAAPSLLPPPSPRAWQEKRATWSGNKGPRGPPRSGTPRSGASATSLQARGTDAARGRLPPTRAGPGRVLGGLRWRVQTCADPHARRRFQQRERRFPRPRSGRSAPRRAPGPQQGRLVPPALLPCPSALRGCGRPPAAANRPSSQGRVPRVGPRGAPEGRGGGWGSSPGIGTPLRASRPL